MPRTDTDEVYRNGVLQSSRQRVVSDEEIRRAETIPDNLRNAIAAARSWAADAAATDANWPTMTAAQKDNAERVVIRRLGTFFDRFGDLLEALGADR